MRRWGASNELRDGLCLLAGHLDAWPRAAEMPLCDFKRLLASGQFDRLRSLWRAEERAATGGERQSRRIARRARAIPPEKVAPPPLVTGADLIAMGMTEGPALGHVLRAIYDAQLDERITGRDEAMDLARALAGG